MNNFHSFAPRLLAGFSTLTLLAAGCLFASSRPAHTAGGAVAVNVANLPLPTVAADNPAKQPFQARIEIRIEDGSREGSHNNEAAQQGATVPPGKRLIVQTVSHFRYRTGGLPPPSTQTVQIEAETKVNGDAGFYPLPPVAGNGQDYLGTSQSLSFAADAGPSLVFNAFRSDTAGQEIEIVTVYGYLVNVT